MGLGELGMGHRSPERKSSFPLLSGESREELWICFKDERNGQATVVSFQEHPYLNIETVHLCQSRVSGVPMKDCVTFIGSG